MGRSLHALARLAALVAVAGCGESGGGGGSSGGPAASAGSSSAPAPAAWTQYHGAADHAGLDATEPTASSPRIEWQSPLLDGQVHASPLLLGDAVYVATEHDSVYALDASTGAIRWRATLGVALGGRQVDPHVADHTRCGAEPEYGVVSTPVIDTARGELFAVAMVEPGSYHLDGVDLASGRVLLDKEITPPAMNVLDQQQRAALVIDQGRVYAGFGGFNGDCGRYHGWIVGAAEDGTGPVISFTTEGTSAGIWGPSGPAVLPDGSMLVATGNSGTSDSPQANSVLRLSPALTTTGSFAPPDRATLTVGDLDFGSMGPSVLGTDLAFQAGKAGVGYVYSISAMASGAPALFSAHICSGAYGGTAWAPPFLYVPCLDGLHALRVDGDQFSVAWVGPKTWAGPPVVSGGLVWSQDTSGSTLLGFDPASGHAAVSLSVGQTVHFATPASGGGRLVIATRAPRVVSIAGV
jgi:hypothetical protein